MKYTGENPNSINRIASGSVAINVESVDITTLTSTGLQISGTLNVSQSITASNVTVGTPTNKPWQEDLDGSIFNLYDATTPTSNILRVIAGYLSSSLPAPTPNIRDYGSLAVDAANTTTQAVSSYAPGFVPDDFQNSAKTGIANIVYLYNKGFAKTGSVLFPDLQPGFTSIYVQNYRRTHRSVAVNSTVASSSLGPQAFGLGALNSVVYASGSHTFNYTDNNSGVITATSSSQHLYSRTGPGSEANSGLQVGTIVTSNPTVILNEYQDGLFTNGFAVNTFNGSGLNIDSRSTASISSSGYYTFTASIGISSSADPGYITKTAQGGIFWAPLSLLTLENNSVTFTTSSQALTVVSRSLSGAPYINSSTYGYEVRIDGLFDPMYTGSTNVASSNITVGSGYISYAAQAANIASNGLINTAGVFFDNTGAGAARSTGIVPFRTDMVRFSVTASSNFGTTSNITLAGSSSNSFTITSYGKDKGGNTTNLPTTIPLFTAGTFGQPASSGSMAYFGRVQGTDPGTDTLEQFYGETSRRQVSASGFDVLTFTAPNWDTSYGLYNLPAKELQIKPGFLVQPGTSNGYWVPDPSPTDTFKYYVKEVTCAVTAPNNIVFSLTSGATGITLVDWESITDGIAVGIMFKSSTAANLGSTARFFNLSKGGGVSGGYSVGTTYNPFASALVIYNEGGGSSGTYTMPVDNGKGMILNGAALNKYYIVVRYRGTVTLPLTQISISYT